MGLYVVSLPTSLLGFGMGLPCVRYYVGVKSSFQHVREECECKRAYVFRCLMFSLCCVFDSVCEMFDEIIRNMFGCGCYLVVECSGSVDGGAQRMCVLCL